MIEGIEYVRTTFPYLQELSLSIHLLDTWTKEPNRKVLVDIALPTEPYEFPITVGLGILAADWPGMSDACFGVIHERGWNIFFGKGFIVPYRGKELGIVISALEFDSQEKLNEFLESKDVLLNKLEQAGAGSRAKAYLLAKETRKLSIFQETVEWIEKTCGLEDREGLLGQDGEAVAFIASRSESYLTERQIPDLADQIITNHQFIERVRSSRGQVQVRARNLSSRKEELTGISVSGFARDITFHDCLEAFEEVISTYVIWFTKEFFTDDGIVVFRFEISDPNKKAFAQSTLDDIPGAVKDVVRRKKEERQLWIKSIGGFEHYLRAIIPFLVDEYKKTEISQVYISPTQTRSSHIDFKIILVISSEDPAQRKSDFMRCVRALDSVAGFNILSVKPPKVFVGEEVNIIDLRANRFAFKEIEEIYTITKDILNRVFGPFRDFDEGMRRMDIIKLQEVMKKLQNIDEQLVRRYYYHLEDFYRAGAPEEEIVSQIQLGVRAMEKLSQSDQPYIILSRNVFLPVDKEFIPLCTIIVIAYTSSAGIFQECLDCLNKYDITVSKSDYQQMSFIFCRMTEEGKPLSVGKKRQILTELKQVIGRCIRT
jgi:hypothetical protein